MFRNGEIEGIVIKEFNVYPDSRGWLSELFRKDELSESFVPQMGYISITHPNIARGPHEHREQTDYFCFLGKFELYLWDNRKESATYQNKKIIHISDRLIVIVPPGVVHAYKNVGDLEGMVFNLPDRLYAGWGRKEKVDEIRYEGDLESPFRIEGF
jgi:dTDP-4-dehydrorhamnose 3,5-epimerase